MQTIRILIKENATTLFLFFIFIKCIVVMLFRLFPFLNTNNGNEVVLQGKQEEFKHLGRIFQHPTIRSFV